MKNWSFWALSALVLSTLSSCRNEDTPSQVTDVKNNVVLTFKNAAGNQDLVLGQTVLTSTSNQKHIFSTLKYVISNIVLVKSDGTEVRYHYDNPDKGAFIIDQQGAVAQRVALTDIPGGEYSQIKFGLGISPGAYTLGQSGQAAFWDATVAAGMAWQWASGYKFLRLEGVYAAPGEVMPGSGAPTFAFHAGNIGNPAVTNTANVYKVVTLSLPQPAKVRTDVAPEIYIKADAAKWLSGATPIVLNDINQMSMSPNLPTVQAGTSNFAEAFTVYGVKN